MDLHRFWHGPTRMYRTDREGTIGRQTTARSILADKGSIDEFWPETKKKKEKYSSKLNNKRHDTGLRQLLARGNP